MRAVFVLFRALDENAQNAFGDKRPSEKAL